MSASARPTTGLRREPPVSRVSPGSWNLPRITFHVHRPHSCPGPDPGSRGETAQHHIMNTTLPHRHVPWPSLVVTGPDHLLAPPPSTDVPANAGTHSQPGAQKTQAFRTAAPQVGPGSGPGRRSGVSMRHPKSHPCPALDAGREGQPGAPSRQRHPSPQPPFLRKQEPTRSPAHKSRRRFTLPRREWAPDQVRGDAQVFRYPNPNPTRVPHLMRDARGNPAHHPGRGTPHPNRRSCESRNPLAARRIKAAGVSHCRAASGPRIRSGATLRCFDAPPQIPPVSRT